MAKILIIDNEIVVQNSLKGFLKLSNPKWEILTASNEHEGINILEQQLKTKIPVEVVLTDLVMASEESGMNILRKARSIDPLVMIILYTAFGKKLDRYAAFSYGAFDVIDKSVLGKDSNMEMNIKARAALRYREWSKRINFLRRYFDPKVFDVIENKPSLLSMALRTITIVFWDIRGFSKLCESLKAHPKLISGFLNDYCETGAKTIFKNGGILDKFIGDGIMALFGVLDHKDNVGKAYAISAVRAGMDFRTKFHDINKKWTDTWKMHTPDRIEIGLACGIHSGEALVGNVGTDFRDQFTALGPHVNFASRIEGRCEPGRILISQSTEVRVRGEFCVSPAGEITDIKNIPGTFYLYEVSEKK
jgi:class 3 adenylate cyclase/DNA-binding NarL/FixJ family response regulator